MTVLSLFDGISCGQVAMERAGIPVDKYYACEVDKYAIQTTQKNYPETVQLGDVFDVDFSALPKIDIVIGGSPCTHWSIAKRDRETTPDGLGGQLFMQYVRALEETKPRWFLYENNFSIHKNIKDFISEKLGVQPIMINSALVSAQNRRRCYWTNIPVEQPKDRGIVMSDIIESGMSWREKAVCVKASDCNRVSFYHSFKKSRRTNIAEPVRIGDIGSLSQANRVYSVCGKSVCLQANAGGGGAKTGLYKIDLPDGDYTIRKLTPVECERLQTLPDGYTSGVSDTQRYKQIGNGWTVDVIAHILRGIV